MSDPAQNQAYYGPGVAATHPYGVLYQGEYETAHDGTAVAVRLHARALAAQGLPLLIRSFSGMVTSDKGQVESIVAAGIPAEVTAELGSLRHTSIERIAIAIRHMVVRGPSALDGHLVPRHAVHTDVELMRRMRRGVLDTTITYTVWERDRVSRSIAEQLAQVGQNWVPCQHNAAMLIRCGVPADKVHVVPHPYDTADPIAVLTERAPYPERRFYAIGRWEPRKGYHELVGAFLAAFRPGDAATLTIKTSAAEWPGYPTPDASLAYWRGRYTHWTDEAIRRQIVIDTRRYPRSRIVKLHFDGNIYCCPSHGEAWALPAFEAKLAGNALVHVPYGGTADFCDPAVDVAVPYSMEPDHKSYGWEPGAEWAGFTHDALVAALRSAEPPRAFVRPDGFECRFGMAAVGRQMAGLLMAQVDRVAPHAAAYLRAQMERA